MDIESIQPTHGGPDTRVIIKLQDMPGDARKSSTQVSILGQPLDIESFDVGEGEIIVVIGSNVTSGYIEVEIAARSVPDLVSATSPQPFTVGSGEPPSEGPPDREPPSGGEPDGVPRISSMSPKSVSRHRESFVSATFTGANLESIAAINFGTVSVRSVQHINSTKIKANIPSPAITDSKWAGLDSVRISAETSGGTRIPTTISLRIDD